MAICKKRAACKAAGEAPKGSFIGRCLRRLLVCTALVGVVVAAVAYLGRPGTGDGEGA